MWLNPNLIPDGVSDAVVDQVNFDKAYDARFGDTHLEYWEFRGDAAAWDPEIFWWMWATLEEIHDALAA